MGMGGVGSGHLPAAQRPQGVDRTSGGTRRWWLLALLGPGPSNGTGVRARWPRGAGSSGLALPQRARSLSLHATASLRQPPARLLDFRAPLTSSMDMARAQRASRRGRVGRSGW